MPRVFLTTILRSHRGILIEALVSAAIVMTLALVLNPTAPGSAAVHPHLLWIAVLILAAQYGARGLLAALGANVVLLSLASVCAGESLGWLLDRASDGSELLALSGAIAVAWVVGGHARRKQTLEVTTSQLTEHATEATSAFGQLRNVATGLARHVDRAQLSISYLRTIAQRIEGDDPVDSANAALELALGRIGAHVGAVLVHDGSRLRLFAHRGVWSAQSAVPPNLFHDRTAELAFKRGLTTTSLELDTLNELDSDVAAPVFDKQGKPCGVILVRRLDFDLELACMERYERTCHELVAIASWVSRSLAQITPAPAANSGYSYAFRAGERRDVIVLRKAANDAVRHDR